nr:hypothetical protein [Edaphobacter flagellatus]
MLNELREAQTKGLRFGILYRLQRVDRFLPKLKKLLSSDVKGLPCGRELNAVTDPEEELHVKEIFDVADLLTEVGLDYVQSLGGPRHVQLFGDGHNVSKMAKFQVIVDAHRHTPKLCGGSVLREFSLGI